MIDLSLIKAFPSISNYLSWVYLWFPDKYHAVLKELDNEGLLEEIKVSKESFCHGIMATFYWRSLKPRVSYKKARRPTLSEIEKGFPRPMRLKVIPKYP